MILCNYDSNFYLILFNHNHTILVLKTEIAHLLAYYTLAHLWPSPSQLVSSRKDPYLRDAAFLYGRPIRAPGRAADASNAFHDWHKKSGCDFSSLDLHTPFTHYVKTGSRSCAPCLTAAASASMRPTRPVAAICAGSRLERSARSCRAFRPCTSSEIR